MRPARLYAAGAQCIAASLCFFLTAVVKLPVVLYFPLSRRWSLAPNPSELSMDFYGRSLLALAVGAVAALGTLAVFWVYKKLRGAAATGGLSPASASESASESSSSSAADRRRESGLVLLAGYMVTALLLAMGVYAYELYGRVPVPEPLPAGLLAPPISSPAAPAAPPIPLAPLAPATSD